MDRTPVSSSNVASVGYDSQIMVLEVEFSDGAIYQYFDVPEDDAVGLLNSDSVGKYLNSNIKGHYRYARI
ncbi:MAG TPA: KTSC domain-containing protein [Solirubrobacteraceae bacterium]|jgi:hypothetical protein|nr:KTSC domain-containing protein [Solirubrobacteraceae bacterium]